MFNKLKKPTKPEIPEKKERKTQTLNKAIRLLQGRQKVLNSFESKIFPTEKLTQGKGLKILSPKQMLQKLPTAQLLPTANY